MKNNMVKFITTLLMIFMVISCSEDEENLSYPKVDRHDKLPADIIKRTPETDFHPPILDSDEFEQPVPLGPAINTSGVEDSPFVTPDGNTMYFFFTPDVRVPVNEQLLDEVTGVWVSHRSEDGEWSEAERLWLQYPGKLALDGAVCVQDDEMWFASAREGYTGVNMFTAELTDGKWRNWKYCGDRLMNELQIGEVHITGNDLYFHSDREDGAGDYDLWQTTRDGSVWSDAENISELNTTGMDGFPFVSSNGDELWFMRNHLGTPAIYRSKRETGGWSMPEVIVRQFAGEPTRDDAGNLYFVHPFYENDVMIEADIYVAYSKERK
ncbi:MAG: hypothetical protein R6V47_01960 [Candidatus Delongbacteria bacterium]